MMCLTFLTAKTCIQYYVKLLRVNVGVSLEKESDETKLVKVNEFVQQCLQLKDSVLHYVVGNILLFPHDF